MQAPFIFGQATAPGWAWAWFLDSPDAPPTQSETIEALAVAIPGGSGAWTIYGSVGSMVVYAVVYYGGGDKDGPTRSVVLPLPILDFSMPVSFS